MRGVVNENGETLKAGCVVIDDGQVLLVTNRHNGVWGLPKGHIEPGEEAVAAAERETYEETGYRVLALVELSDRHYESLHTGRAIHGRYWLARLAEQVEPTGFIPEETRSWFPTRDATKMLSESNAALVLEALTHMVPDNTSAVFHQ